jgi:hypothetical protein
LGANFHGGRLPTSNLVYLVERFHTCGGRIGRLRRISCGRTYSHQIAVRSVAEGGYPAKLHSYGGIFRSELTVCFWSSFNGFSNLYVGRTWRCWTCISAQNELLLYQVPLYFVLVVFHLLLSSYIHIYSKLVFLGGVLSRVMLTKNTCVQKCMC